MRISKNLSYESELFELFSYGNSVLKKLFSSSKSEKQVSLHLLSKFEKEPLQLMKNGKKIIKFFQVVKLLSSDVYFLELDGAKRVEKTY